MSFGGEYTRVPGEKYRDYIVLLVAILGGLIPETGSAQRAMFVSAIIPPLLAGIIALYYRGIPLGWKTLLAVLLSCVSLFLRWFTTWFAIEFIFPEAFDVIGWPVRHYFFFASLLAPCAAVIPAHFIILFVRRRLEKTLKDRQKVSSAHIC